MEIIIERKYLKSKYTIGNLYIVENGSKKWICNTIEDKVRDLNKDGDLDDYGEGKVYGETAIPYGRYKVDMETVSPKFSRYTFYRNVCQGKLPRLLNVKHFAGILMHVADGDNGADLLLGCIGVGKNTIKGGLTDGKNTFIKVYRILKEYHDKGEEIWVTIE